VLGYLGASLSGLKNAQLHAFNVIVIVIPPSRAVNIIGIVIPPARAIPYPCPALRAQKKTSPGWHGRSAGSF